MTASRIGWRRGVAALAALACLGLVGCDSGDAGGTSDSGLPSADETTASSEPTSDGTDKPAEPPPTLPARARGLSPAAAKAFARHVVDLINYSTKTADWHALQEVSLPGCFACENLIKNAKARSRIGTRVEGGLASIVYIRYLRPRPPQSPALDILIKFSEARIFVGGKSKPKRVAPTQANLVWYLKYTKSNTWKLAHMEMVD